MMGQYDAAVGSATTPSPRHLGHTGLPWSSINHQSSGSETWLHFSQRRAMVSGSCSAFSSRCTTPKLGTRLEPFSIGRRTGDEDQLTEMLVWLASAVPAVMGSRLSSSTVPLTLLRSALRGRPRTHEALAANRLGMYRSDESSIHQRTCLSDPVAPQSLEFVRRGGE